MSVHAKYKQQKRITLPLLKYQQSDVRMMLGKDSDEEEDMLYKQNVRIARDVKKILHEIVLNSLGC